MAVATAADPGAVALPAVGTALGSPPDMPKPGIASTATTGLQQHKEYFMEPTQLPERDRIYAAISDAFYDARNSGRTMTQAANAATDKVLAIFAEVSA